MIEDNSSVASLPVSPVDVGAPADNPEVVLILFLPLRPEMVEWAKAVFANPLNSRATQ